MKMSMQLRTSLRGLLSVCALLTGLAPAVGGSGGSWAVAGADVIVDDSWADGGRDDGADALDSNWWTSASPNGIEVAVGSLGMVTGTSGRGIHTVFSTQTLANIGDTLVATYTFRTPATVGMGRSAAFRVGLFDTLGRTGLNADVFASSGSPSPLYGYYATGATGLPGYMMDMDVGTGTDDLNFRRHETEVNVPAQTPTGRLMGTTTGFTGISPSGPDDAYFIVPNTTYTGSLTITRVSATEMELIGTLGSAVHTVTAVFDSASFGLLAFHANANAFGDSSIPGEPNNGIDFLNVRIEFIGAPSACPCDWDGTGGVNSADFFAFLADFFDGNADFNRSGATDSGDFFDFLVCFFEGCG